MQDIARLAVQAALDAGARYADARVIESRAESLRVRNGAVETILRNGKLGVGVRALADGGWGFYATPDLSPDAVRRAAEQAMRVARASAHVPGEAIQLAAVPPAHGEYHTPVQEDPFQVPLNDKISLLAEATQIMKAVQGVRVAEGSMDFWRTETWFASSEGGQYHQTIIQSGGGIDAQAVSESESQNRSYPQAFGGHYETSGYELIRSFQFLDHAQRVAEEAVALLHAPACPSGEMDLLLDGSQLGLQIHESVGHAIELDRMLGWEAAYAGTSFLKVSDIGTLKYGSPLMNIVADATVPGGMATFGYDDEGTPAQCVDIVREGILVGVLTGRDSAHIAGLPPGGMVRCDGYNRLPMVRMTNVGLKSGEGTLEEFIADTKQGVYMDVNRSWSIDDKRLNFQFGCQLGWEIENGKRKRMVKNPTYTGITPQFWAKLDRLAGRAEWRLWGVPNCGKGQPGQTARTGHGAAPARFRNVRVGVTR